MLITLLLSLSGLSATRASAAEAVTPAKPQKASAPRKTKAAVKKSDAASDPSEEKPEPTATPAATPTSTPTATPAPKATATPVPAATGTPPGFEPAPAPETTPTSEPVADPANPEAKPESKAKEYEGYGKTHGLLGPVTFGPTIAILQVPHPLQAGIEAKFRDIVGVGYQHEFFPKVTVKEISVKLDSWDVRLRWHPFFGRFFLGAAIGQQKVTASKTQTVNFDNAQLQQAGFPSSLDVALSGEIQTTYISPMLGWRFVTDVGFFYGIELGWQFTRSAQTTLSTNQDNYLNDPRWDQYDHDDYAKYQKSRQDVIDKANDYGKIGLPHVTLVQIGWMF